MEVIVLSVEAVPTPYSDWQQKPVSPVLASSTVSDTDAYLHWLSACKRLNADCNVAAGFARQQTLQSVVN